MQENIIPIPVFHQRMNSKGEVKVYCELPKIPLYGRFNPVPRDKRVSKVTGLPFPTGISEFVA